MTESMEEILTALATIRLNAEDMTARVAALERLCGEAADLLASMPKLPGCEAVYNKLRAAAEGKEVT